MRHASGLSLRNSVYRVYNLNVIINSLSRVARELTSSFSSVPLSFSFSLNLQNVANFWYFCSSFAPCLHRSPMHTIALQSNTTLTASKTNRNLFMYLSKTHTELLCTEGFGCRQDLPLRSRFRGYQKQFHGLSLFLSLSHPLCHLLGPLATSILRRSFVLRLPGRRLLPCAFALGVISKNFWRWIVPRDGNRGPAAFTQTTGETTFPSVRASRFSPAYNQREK